MTARRLDEIAEEIIASLLAAEVDSVEEWTRIARAGLLKASKETTQELGECVQVLFQLSEAGVPQGNDKPGMRIFGEAKAAAFKSIKTIINGRLQAFKEQEVPT